MISPLTEAQSGESGKLTVSDSLYQADFSSPNFGIEYFGFDVFGLGLDNIDTLSSPFSLLLPTNQFMFENLFAIGDSLSPLRLIVSLSFLLESDYFDMDDSVEFSVEFESVSIVASILAIMESKSFMEYPVEYVLHLQCWLAAITHDSVAGYDRTLSFPGLSMKFSDGKFNASCTRCSSSGMTELPSLVSNLGSTFNKIICGIPDFLKDILDSDLVQVQIDHWLVEAANACPYKFVTPSSSYGRDEDNTDFPAINILTLQYWDFIALTGISIIEIFVVIVLTNIDVHLSDVSDPFLGEQLLESSLPSNSNILNLSEGFVGTIIRERKP